MANRRMISRPVIDTDKFAMMSMNARYLYFELLVRADDDGFLGAPMRIVRMVGCTEADMEELERNGYIIKFETGIVVIRDWKVHNSVRKDIYKATEYQEEFNMLCEINGRYYLKTECTDGVTQNVTDGVTCDVTSNVTLGKDSIGKDSIGKKDICTEPEESVSMPPVISLILNDKSFHDIYQADIDSWKELYPAVNVLQELRKMKGWLDSNTAKRKTQRGIKRFINGWLAREQDRSGAMGNEEDISHLPAGTTVSELSEEMEAEIYRIASRRISPEAIERYTDKMHELICLCCPIDEFSQNQIDYMRNQWGVEPLKKEDTLIPPREDDFSYWDMRLHEEDAN